MGLSGVAACVGCGGEVSDFGFLTCRACRAKPVEVPEGLPDAGGPA